MKILILEDEEPNYKRLSKMLANLRPNAEVFGPIDNVAEVRVFLTENTVDLIVADIRLSDGLAFEAFDETDLRCPVIFTTAYDEYAIKAFKYNGIDYLLKPIVKEELAMALDKSDALKGKDEIPGLNELFRLLDKDNTKYRRRFLVPDRDGMIAVSTEQIRYISYENGMAKLYLTKNRIFSIDYSLDEIERELDPEQFLRVTRYHIVSISAIERLTTWFGRKTKIQIIDWPDAEIYIIKEKAPLLKRWLDR